MQNIYIIIPARYSSSRFPGKPLAQIAGCSMLERVFKIASANILQKHNVIPIIATDDDRVYQHAKQFNAEVVMTPDTCNTGTDRAQLVANKIAQPNDIIIVLQGDAPVTPPWVINDLIEALIKDQSIKIATPIVKLTNNKLAEFIKHKQISPATGTTVTFDKNFNALYFSKNIIPFWRKLDENSFVYRHIGIYGYKNSFLQELVTMPDTQFDAAEKLEQLKILENGHKIKVVITDYKNRTHGSVDSPEDIAVIEQIIQNEGELF